MQVRITCECGQVVEADAASAGRTARCPACGRAVVVPSVAPAPAPPAPPPARKRRRGLAIASMIVGIVSCIPCCAVACGIGGIVAGLVAIGLGIPAMIGKLDGRGFGIAGVVLGGVGILISLLPWGFLGLARGLWTFRGGGPTTGPAVTVVDGPPTPPAPPALTADEIAAALKETPKRPRDDRKARGELRKALAAYKDRRAGLARLWQCVRHFRTHLACSGLDRPAEAEHAKAFATAADELLDAVLADYRRAGELQQDEKWRQAAEAFDKLASDLAGRDDSPLLKNVREQARYCRRRRKETGDGPD